ncbi:MAG: sigma-70 family RNA polymerase sigma factor [Kiritimatiellae bacterium]|nr:sigma-70 family RNA polymerase sigma factor [Kiritimatiellia bacterium]
MRPEEERLRAAQRGDMDAFAELFEELRPVVHAVATRLVGPDEAGDVVMDAFLKAWHSLPDFRRGSSLKTWLFRIVSNCALDHLRGRARRREQPLDHEAGDDATVAEPPAETVDGPDSLTERSDMVGIVKRAMRELSDEHRTALELRYVDGLSYAEIAAVTGVSIGTVMSRLFNAKRRLRTAVEKLTK